MSKHGIFSPSSLGTHRADFEVDTLTRRGGGGSLEATQRGRQGLGLLHHSTGWGRISGIMLEPISETIYAVDTISQLPKAC